MSAKTDTPEQHRILHNFWPNNCCLCDKEFVVSELKQQILNLELEVQKLKLDLSLMISPAMEL